MKRLHFRDRFGRGGKKSSAFDGIKSHLKWHGDVDQRHFAQIADNGRQRLYEMSTGAQQTQPGRAAPTWAVAKALKAQPRSLWAEQRRYLEAI